MSLYLIIMGVQGAGKGTQAAYIHETYNVPHVSTGDLFRAMKTRTDDLAREVQAIMKSGNLVSDEVTNKVLQDRLEQDDAADGVILDGYPRNIDQAKWLENYLGGKGESLAAVLLLELDYYTAFKRAFGRVKDGKTGQVYNIYSTTDELDAAFIEDPNGKFQPRIEATLKSTGQILERRADDHAGSVVKRIDTFEATTKPLIDYYEDKGLLVRINAKQPIEEVSAAVKAAIDQVKA